MATVTDVETVMAALALHDVDVVGHSMGGIIAGYYGTAHPQTRREARGGQWRHHDGVPP